VLEGLETRLGCSVFECRAWARGLSLEAIAVKVTVWIMMQRQDVLELFLFPWLKCLYDFLEPVKHVDKLRCHAGLVSIRSDGREDTLAPSFGAIVAWFLFVAFDFPLAAHEA